MVRLPFNISPGRQSTEAETIGITGSIYIEMDCGNWIFNIAAILGVAVCGNLDLSCFRCAHQVWRLPDNFTFQGYNYNIPKICLRCPSCACRWCYQLCPSIYHYHLFVSNLLTELCRQAMCTTKLPGTLWRLQGVMESCMQLCSQWSPTAATLAWLWQDATAQNTFCWWKQLNLSW